MFSGTLCKSNYLDFACVKTQLFVFLSPRLSQHFGNLVYGCDCIVIFLSRWHLQQVSTPIIGNRTLYSLFLASTLRKSVRSPVCVCAGIAFFLPGSLAAFMSADPDLAILGILFLSIGDAGASIGTAAGSFPVGTSSRMVEGSIACWTLCSGALDSRSTPFGAKRCSKC